MNEEIPLVLSTTVNMPVLRMPGRRFPGILVQGDSLSSLYALSKMVLERAEQQSDEELIELAKEMTNELANLLQEYEQVLKFHGLSLPYVSPFSEK